MSQIPREWQFKAGANNPAAASIVVPAAVNGLRHVLTFVNFTALIAGSGIFQPVLEVLDGATSLWTWQMYLNAPAGSTDHDVFTDTLTFMGSPNTAMTVHFITATPVGGVELIQVRGYSI